MLLLQKKLILFPCVISMLFAMHTSSDYCVYFINRKLFWFCVAIVAFFITKDASNNDHIIDILMFDRNIKPRKIIVRTRTLVIWLVRWTISNPRFTLPQFKNYWTYLATFPPPPNSVFSLSLTARSRHH